MSNSAERLRTPAEIAAGDAAMTARGTSVSTLMRRSGQRIADAIARAHYHSGTVVFLAGPGNNGGDALVAAEIMRERGYAVSLVDLAPGERHGAAAEAEHAFRGERIDLEDRRWQRATIIVDGLFGGGLSRNVEGRYAAAVAAINALDAKVIAVDIPSGIDGTTGAVAGCAVRADWTIALHARKPGHLLEPGRQFVGQLTCESIGIPESVFPPTQASAWRNRPQAWDPSWPPQLQGSGHKYNRGHVLVLSGGMLTTGAARLASMAALRTGAGLVTVASPSDALLVNAQHLTTVMLRRCDDGDELSAILSDKRFNAVIIGPGLPPDGATRSLVRAAAGSGAAMVIDAGAITAYDGAAESLSRDLTGCNAVLTPHAGEFGRVFDASGDKLSRVRAAACEVGCVVLEKGPDTVIADAKGMAFINDNAPPTLATAGSGDVLAGIIGGFLAQGAPPLAAASMGVWLHGETGNEAGRAVIADDLIAALKHTRGAFPPV